MAECTHIKDNGERCQGQAVHGSSPQRCYFHSERKRRREPIKTVALESIDTSRIGGVSEFLSKLIASLCKGEVDVRTSNALVYAASHLARILEAGELEQRVEAVEQQLEELNESA
jgi:hypothetical protein